ncbi:MAG: 16S rRNA (guanine(966)-N(2))-methyltransferase RsmD [Candidatus Dadabacteria bacterium]|nr:16S rRNA (guanine(966)-N(2))-methyltransferase RsmD [Candidatus Dadabacteria bacterium]MDE0291151.1 16S rRNA (guanine(966)-N(2))-methyltransferase RsmD [Candidatus Dadabacteria bacterium]MDE0477565.1 16S rRNA (guanine(966)-N(2))-methyltransferase RsmD [Candidatus Dadabacteria bacterium]
MRILTGQSKGKKLKVPRGKSLRPTASRIKKSIFDILSPEMAGTRVLDLFSGSGNLGIEALSLGAAFCVFVEKNPGTAGIIAQNLRSLGYTERSRILNFDFRKALSMLSAENRGFDVVFVDPPYELYEKTEPHELARDIRSVVGEKGVMVIEHPSRNVINSEGLDVRTKKYGGTSVSFLRRLD